MRRLFLACTPRTGNTWLRKLLAAATGFHDEAAHSPAEINWENLPEACIVAMHWHYSQEFADFLRSRHFVPIVIMRHPLDILLSILQFSPHEPATARWLAGEGGDERLLAGADPTSPAFLEYALSERAALLLGISAEWAPHAASVIRYEHLVEEPEAVLTRLLEQTGQRRTTALVDVVAAHTLDKLKTLSRHHFWRGCPGLWRDVLTNDVRKAIATRHARIFDQFSYSCESPAAPTPAAAQQKWQSLCASA